MESEIERQNLEREALLSKIEFTGNIGSQDVLDSLKREIAYLKKALVWKRQEMDLFETKFRSFQIDRGEYLLY